ncbi:uncharacterized protein LOC141629022 [Silene latifolia]|uniref:uncharacterized protein LOC141629022 n=1 Tax=Silene latifolia TaxID=37657 RepID=UPI003D76D44E
MGRSMKTFGLDHLSRQLDIEVQRTRDITDVLDAPIPDEYIACIHSLNMAQQQAFDTIMDHVKNGKPGAFFVDGPGGTGKTFLYNALYAQVRLMGKIVLPTATSGIAASNIPSGRTTHSQLKIPLDLDACMTCNVPKQSSLAALLRETAVFIWDEAAMARKEGIEAAYHAGKGELCCCWCCAVVVVGAAGRGPPRLVVVVHGGSGGGGCRG